MGGNCIGTLLREAAAFDIAAASVQHACAGTVELPVEARVVPMAVVLLGVEHEGRLDYDVSEYEALRSEPWVVALGLDVDIGQKVLPFCNGRNRLGEAFVRGLSRDDLDARVTELRERLALTVSGREEKEGSSHG